MAFSENIPAEDGPERTILLTPSMRKKEKSPSGVTSGVSAISNIARTMFLDFLLRGMFSMGSVAEIKDQPNTPHDDYADFLAESAESAENEKFSNEYGFADEDIRD